MQAADSNGGGDAAVMSTKYFSLTEGEVVYSWKKISTTKSSSGFV